MTSSSEPAGLRLPELAGRAASGPPGPAVGAGEDGGWVLPALHGGPERVEEPGEPGYRRGFAEGRAQGAAEARRDLAPVLQALDRVAGVLDAERVNFGRTRERNLEALALAVAGKLVQREVAADPALVAGLLDRALALLPMDAAVEVRLHPADAALAEAARGGREGGAPERAVSWIPDASLERGAFVVESPVRLVDGRFDVALRTLYDRLDP